MFIEFFSYLNIMNFESKIEDTTVEHSFIEQNSAISIFFISTSIHCELWQIRCEVSSESPL